MIEIDDESKCNVNNIIVKDFRFSRKKIKKFYFQKKKTETFLVFCWLLKTLSLNN